ncbi:putative ankyrin repeat protein [Phytophthora citrophthora]|uniref:Ankyrin repeat protein n=1 Tax=Phytophthora citrophthora TaxID=4793 RepID=A0AAD9GZE7_9STRA|nr:putative ankyrin repeat protein [Phytophthora citrophthora]
MLPPFSAAAFVFRSRPAFDGLSRVVDTVSVFLDSSVDLSLFNACKTGSVRLLDRIWNSSQVFVDGSPDPGTKWTLRRFLRTDKHYQQYLFTKCLEYAVPPSKSGCYQMAFSKFQSFTVTSEVVARACKAGSMDILRFFYENDSRFLEERGEIGRGHPTEWGGLSVAKYDQLVALSMSAAVLSHRSDIVWWLHRYIPDADYDLNTAFNSALMMGDILVAQWLESQGVRVRGGTSAAARAVALKGRLGVLHWLGERGQLHSAIRLLATAARHGHMDIVHHADRLHRIRVIGPAALSIHVAATNGHLEVFKYLRQFVVEQTEKELSVLFPVERTEDHERVRSPAFEQVTGKTMAMAVENGFLDVVKWLYEEYGDDPKTAIFEYEEGQDLLSEGISVMDTAAKYGHLGILKYLHELETAGETRLFCTKSAMDKAAANGHLTTVQWLHNNRNEGCSTAAMDEAAADGHLEVVKWLPRHRAEGCTEKAMDNAAMPGRLERARLLYGIHSEECTTRAMDEAAMRGRLEMVQWLHVNCLEGCTFRAMDEAAMTGHLDMVKWLHENRSEGCTPSAMDEAAAHGHLHVVKWLHSNQTEGCSVRAMSEAAENGHLNFLLSKFEMLMYVRRAFDRLWGAWISVQVEYHGSYSEERLRRLCKYTESLTAWRLLVVCAITPIPCIVLSLLKEIPPLAPAEDGVFKNGMFFARAWAVMVFMGVSALLQMIHGAPRLKLTAQQITLVSLLAATFSALVIFGLCVFTVFPLPFGLLIAGPPFVLVIAVCFTSISRPQWQDDPSIFVDVQRQLVVYNCQTTLPFVYPLYIFGFVSLTGWNQVVFVAVLPVIQIIAKNWISRALADDNDQKPQCVIFVVEVYNALYVSSVLQAAQSWMSTAAIMLVDILQFWVSMSDIVKLLDDVNLLMAKIPRSHFAAHENFVQVAVRLMNIEHSAENKNNIQDSSAKESSTQQTNYEPLQRRTWIPKWITLRKAQVNPGFPLEEYADRTQTLDLIFSQEDRITSRVLYITEYLVLVEYVEVAMPIVYCLHQLILFHMHNGAYYPTMAGVPSDVFTSRLLNTLLYSLFQFGSFILLVVVLKRKLGYSGLEQLAFVLDAHAGPVQTKLNLIFVYIMQVGLIHHGADFTFQFAWLRSKGE